MDKDFFTQTKKKKGEGLLKTIIYLSYYMSTLRGNC
jgi:hypothetical protein